MTKWHVTLAGVIAGDSPAERAAPDVHLDAVMGELVAIDVADPAVSVDFLAGTVLIEIDVDAGSLEEALMSGLGQIRTAVHAAGGITAGWEIQSFESQVVRDEPSDMVDAQ